MGKIDRSNLGFLGDEFQYKLIKTFMDEPKFFKDIYLIVDQNMFTDPYLKDYVGVMKEYYNKHEIVPSYTMMEICLNDKAKTDIQLQFYKDTIKKLKDTTSEGVDEIREKSERFFKQQNMIKVAHEIIKIAGDGNLDEYERCAQLVQDIVTTGAEEDYGIDIFANMDEVLAPDYRVAIPIGIDKIDDELGGGIGKGELGVIIATTGIGKSSMSTAMAAHAAAHRCEYNDFNGFKVLQIMFEDIERDIQRKHYGRITKVEARELSYENNIDNVKEILDNFPDKEILKENLRLKRFRTGEVTPSYLKRFLKGLINTGFRPDLVIVDYFECLVYDNEKDSIKFNEWSMEGKTMRKLEALAHELNIAMWIPTQGGRDGLAAEIVKLEHMGGSRKKGEIANIVMSISKTFEQAKNNKATIAILKNRAGKSNGIFHVKFNNGTCIMTGDVEISFEDAVSYDEYTQKERIDQIVNDSREVFKNQQNKK
jgi:hypothetical protein